MYTVRTFLTEVGRSKEKGALSSDAVALQLDQTTTKRGDPARHILNMGYTYTDSLFATLTVPKSDLITIAKYCQNPLAKLILCIPLHSCQNLPLHSCQNSQTQTQTKLFVSIYFLLFTLSTNPKSDRLSSL